MEEQIVSFSSRVKLVCRLSNDQARPVHYLSIIRGRPDGCFICGTKKTENIGEFYYLRCDTCEVDVHRSCYSQPVCRLSDISKPHTLQKNYVAINSTCYACKKSLIISERNSRYYHCDTCNVDFHEDCPLYLAEFTHPFHPLHPLKFTFSSTLPYTYSDLNVSIKLPSFYLEEERERDDTSDQAASISDAKCKCCQRERNTIYYHCSVCNYSLNLECSKNPPPLTLFNVKSHDHTLTLFPRRINLPCDACGLSLQDGNDHVYTCHLCSYMVHKTCIYLPRVIKITRHPHRLSFTSSSSLPSGIFPCGVCRRPVNVTCGQFSCQRGCEYAIHSKCAVNGRVWDGIDLDGVPEDPEEDKDVAPFVRIDDETIKHFSHDHHYLRLQRNNEIRDEDRFCEACCVQVVSDESFYSCMECGFLLHEACASLPRRKELPLHRHPLILHPRSPFTSAFTSVRRLWKGWRESDALSTGGVFKCDACDQRGYGFVYKCSVEKCEFWLDTRCASLPDPVTHACHSHDMFFNFTKGECMGCKSTTFSTLYLECIECNSFLGFKCATLPSLMHYKHDRHPLALCYGEEGTTIGQSWCEVCEGKLDAKEWFYTCDDYCSVAVHINCLLGKERYMKPLNMGVDTSAGTVSIHYNGGNTRPICRTCGLRSTEPLSFKTELWDVINLDFCSLRCLLSTVEY